MKWSTRFQYSCILLTVIMHGICLYSSEHGIGHAYYLDEYTQPWEDAQQAPERIEFEFEDAQLINVIRYVENQFNITCILDDMLDPVPKDGQSALGTKVSFKTHDPLTREQAWKVFLTFLDMAGLAPRPGPYAGSYRITTTNPKSNMNVYNEPLPTYIGVHPDQLPSSDMPVRYVYFVRNASQDVIKNVMDQMKGSQAPALVPFPDMRAIMITDKAYNIQAIMRVVRELDTVAQPETMSIIKLKRTDATRVAQLYKDLVKEDEKQQQNLSSRLLGSKRDQTVRYFPSGTRVIPEPRTNTLVILGTQDSIEKIESFITNEIDREINVPFKPTHIYTLNHVQAKAAADILQKAVQFKPESEAAKSGGVRDGDQYMKPVSIVPEETGNRLIITADYDEYHKIEDILNQIDIEQPQVAIKVMLINITLDDTRTIGTQIRNKVPGTEGVLSDEVNFQTTGLGGSSTAVTRNQTGTTGATRLLGDLINLAANSTSIGSTFITLGSDTFGVWGIFRMLQEYTQANIISNPFLVTSNKTKANLSVGERRRVQQSVVQGTGTSTSSFENKDAKLEIDIIPQISYEGFVTLNVTIRDEQFTGNVQDPIQSGNKSIRELENSVIMKDKEVLALGGTIQTSFNETETGVPLLKDIPGFGYLFKNKSKTYSRNTILILITPEIIPAQNTHVAARYTDSKITETKDTVSTQDYTYLKQDPFHRWFFNDLSDEGVNTIDQYMEREGKYNTFAQDPITNGSPANTSYENPKPAQYSKQGKQKLSRLLTDKGDS